MSALPVLYRDMTYYIQQDETQTASAELRKRLFLKKTYFRALHFSLFNTRRKKMISEDSPDGSFLPFTKNYYISEESRQVQRS